MATLPAWCVGRHVTACTLTPQAINATTGVLSDTTPVAALYGHLDGVEAMSRITTENISPMNSLFENQVYIETGTEYRITEIEKNEPGGAATASLLASAAFNGGSSIFKILLTRGGRSWTGFGLLGEYTSRMSKNRVVGECRLLPIDINGFSGSGSANPSYG